jgi:hypothetical protein
LARGNRFQIQRAVPEDVMNVTGMGVEQDCNGSPAESGTPVGDVRLIRPRSIISRVPATMLHATGHRPASPSSCAGLRGGKPYGTSDQACVDDRRRVSVALRWDWFVGYRDPIGSDPLIAAKATPALCHAVPGCSRFRRAPQFGSNRAASPNSKRSCGPPRDLSGGLDLSLTETLR